MAADEARSEEMNMERTLGDASRSGLRQVDVTKLIDNSTRTSLPITVAVICFLAIVFDGLDSGLFGTLLSVLMKGMKMGPAEAGGLGSIGDIGGGGGGSPLCAGGRLNWRERGLLL